MLRRSALIGIVLGVPLSAAFLWLALRGVDLDRVWATTTSASLLWLVAVFACFVATYLVFSLRWARLLRPLGPIRFRRVVGLVLAGAALSNTVPGRPGELARGYAAARILHVPAGAGIGTVVVDRACDVVVLTAALIVVLPFTPHPAWLNGIILGALAVGAVLLGVLAAARWRVHGAGRRLRGERGTRSRVREVASSFVDGLATLRSPRDAVAILLLTALAWFCFGVGAFCCAQAVGLQPSVEQLVFLTAVLNLGVAFPSSPGFIGTYQWLIVSVLSLYDIPRSAAFAFSILLHAMSFVPITVLGYFVISGLALARRRRIRDA